jgi:hypothetical protein
MASDGDKMYELCKEDMGTFYGLAKGAIEPIGILFRCCLRSACVCLVCRFFWHIRDVFLDYLSRCRAPYAAAHMHTENAAMYDG